MVRIGTLCAALLSAAVYLVSTPALACDEQAKGEPKMSAPRHGRTVSVLDRVDRILESASCKCETAIAGKCDCAHPERRVFEKLSGAHTGPQLPKDARYDASAGVLL